MKTMILVWIIGLLNFCMELFDEEETINPFFFNLGLKEHYLVYWLCFGLELVDCNPQLRNVLRKYWGLRGDAVKISPTSNHPNSVSDVLRLYGKTFESRIHPYKA